MDKTLSIVNEFKKNDFYARIRDSKKELYYYGFKPYEIDSDGKIKLIVDKFLVYNSKNITKNTTKEERKKLKNSLKTNRDSLYNEYSLKSIKFKNSDKKDPDIKIKREQALNELDLLFKTNHTFKTNKYEYTLENVSIDTEEKIAELFYIEYESVFK